MSAEVFCGTVKHQVDTQIERTLMGVLPGSSDVPASLAWIARRQGHWDETVGYYEQALVLDPRNIGLLIGVAANYSDLRKFDEALKLCDRALDIQPNDSGLMALKAGIC